MENNKLIGYLLIVLLLITYYTYFVPDYEPDQTNNSENEEFDTNNPEVDDVFITEQKKSVDKTNDNFIYNENQKDIIVENENIILTFSNKGAYIKKVILKDHSSIKTNQLDLINDNSSIINYKLFQKNNLIDFNELIFSSKIEKKEDSTIVSFYIESKNGEKIYLKYKLPFKGYVIENKITFSNYKTELDKLNLFWSNNVIHHEKNYEYEKSVTTINYYDINNQYDYLTASSKEIIEKNLTIPLKWISTKQQYFSSAIISKNNFNNSFLKTIYNSDTSYVKSSIIETEIPINNNSSDFLFYFGPNKLEILKSISDGFDKNVYLGWWGVSSFNKYIIVPIFNLLEEIVGNYGIIIFIMVILIRVIITPFTYKSHISMAKMKILNPEINNIKEKHSGDMKKSQVEIMQLYQKTGVNPLSGCLPLLFQLPILISVFYFLPNAVELRQKSFLWAEDLSSYDSILNLPFSIPLYGDHVSLFTLLMTVSTLLMNSANSQMQTIQGPMKTMQYIFPFMFLFIFNSFSSGLTYYYFLSNLVSYGQIYLFRRFVDEEKIKKELDFNRKQNLNKKKSSFKLRLEEAMKANQEAKKNNKKNNS